MNHVSACDCLIVLTHEFKWKMGENHLETVRQHGAMDRQRCGEQGNNIEK